MRLNIYTEASQTPDYISVDGEKYSQRQKLESTPSTPNTSGSVLLPSSSLLLSLDLKSFRPIRRLLSQQFSLLYNRPGNRRRLLPLIPLRPVRRPSPAHHMASPQLCLRVSA